MVDVLELLVTAVTCILIITNASSASAAVRNVNITKPNCKTRCGEVNIPFPFVVGSNCYLNKGFEIVCNESTNSPKPYLKHTQWEVLYISDFYSRFPISELEYQWDSQYFKVKNSISFSGCRDNKTGSKPLNLRGTPFHFVSNRNTFVAVGCGVQATIDSGSGSIISEQGCKSVCSSSDHDHNNTKGNGIRCEGKYCCEAPIEDIPDTFDIKMVANKTEANRDQCKFSFMIDNDYWSDYKKNSTSFTKIRDMDSVPVALTWSINSTDFEFQDRLSFCGYVNDPKSERCFCTEAEGNPYLFRGCKGKCEMDPGTCGPLGTCVNRHCSYKHKFILIGVGSAFGLMFLLLSVWGLYKFIKKTKDIKRKKKFFKRNGGLLLQQQISSVGGNIQKMKLFNSIKLRKATNNFSIDRILGQGGQGTVYKGMLEDGKIVAIKKSKVVDEAQLSEFINEVVILSQINHRNVVQLLGCCLETEVPLLVYEFISNGTLSQYIHERNVEFPFTWKMRLRVAIEAAGALSYLHSAASFPIYHRDIKSTNILLDEKYRAKVADFGTSRTISVEQTHLTTIVYGTFGYLDPEYFQSSQFTDKSDVYSFGVVLVELLTGQKAIPVTCLEEGKNLASHFTMTMEAGGNVFHIIDPQVAEDASEEEIGLVANLAQRCLNLNGRNRPTMNEVKIALEEIQRPERAASGFQQNHEEVEYVMTQFNEPRDDDYTSTISASERTTSTSTSFHHELPLLSIESQ